MALDKFFSRIKPRKRIDGPPDDYDDTEIVRRVRSTPPSHYKIKIASYSSLIEASKYRGNRNATVELGEFCAAGYKWVLKIQPNGGVEKHISMYITLVDRLGKDYSVTALFKFFIYDQKHDNYLTVQDLTERRFHDMKDTWGIPNVISLKTFHNNASNGYLVNDSCVFGAEVFVIPNTTTTSSIMSKLTLKEDNMASIMTWRVKFLARVTETSSSPVFSCCNHSWQFLLTRSRKGDEKSSDHFELRLRLMDAADDELIFLEPQRISKINVFLVSNLHLKNEANGYEVIMGPVTAWLSDTETDREMTLTKLTPENWGFGNPLLIKLQIKKVMELKAETKP